MLKLNRHRIKRNDSLMRYLIRQPQLSNKEAKEWFVCFEFKNDERIFAKTFLRQKSNFWLFRTHQQFACGDFIIVDMSSTDRSYRPVYIIDLKQGSCLIEGGGGAGIQFQRTNEAMFQLADRYHVINATNTPIKLVGDKERLLHYFRKRPLP